MNTNLEPDVLLTCECCEETSYAVAWCDHSAMCSECRAYFGCTHCRLDARMGW